MFRRIINTILFTSIFISIGSVFIVLRTMLLLELKIDWDLLVFVFFSTLFTYNISKLIPLRYSTTENYAYNFRNEWNLKNEKLLRYLSIIPFFIVVIFAFNLKLNQILFLTHLGFISVFYAIPFLKGKSLRSIPIAKIFLIAYVWAAISILPSISCNREIFLIFIENLFFVIAITIPFDIRDYTRDLSQNIKTIPLALGVEKAKYLAVICILISTAISHLLMGSNFVELVNFGINLLIIPIILYAKEDHSEYYYLGLLDGMLILRVVTFI